VFSPDKSVDQQSWGCCQGEATCVARQHTTAAGCSKSSTGPNRSRCARRWQQQLCSCIGHHAVQWNRGQWQMECGGSAYHQQALAHDNMGGGCHRGAGPWGCRLHVSLSAAACCGRSSCQRRSTCCSCAARADAQHGARRAGTALGSACEACKSSKLCGLCCCGCGSLLWGAQFSI
jgi:hypothetical protein